jgi:hypothetical protein
LHPLRITEFDIPTAFRAGVGRHFGKAGKDTHFSAMRAHFNTHFEGEFHLVKRPLQIRRRNCANDGATFVALDTRVISADDGVQTAATVWRSEVGMR